MSSPSSPPELLVVVGPTASGKSELALTLSQSLDGEIVNADSMQVYRYFDIGTAKPSAQERSRVRHHLVDIVEPDAPMDAARWCELADAAVADIHAKGRQPIVCGGTFLWVKALLYGLAKAPAGDPELRARHREIEKREGRVALHRELARVDPSSAARLNPNDFVRVSRALEVYELSGEPMSSFQERHGFREPRYRARLLGVAHPRLELDQRIRKRAHAMFEAGWVDEVQSLLARGYADTRAMQSVGYKQIAAAQLAGDRDGALLEEAVYRATRVFARRQRTWLKDQPVHWVDPELLGAPNPALRICEALARQPVDPRLR